ncbi:von Willebrand factor D and EGF domain-containing protein-like [Ostrea edulis]|uniref:von Willebrand factor D and EGF domain-containing protein-like n=1 Tax=Ostrea edulis TaxID=37623 RepID=UPI0024AFA079|nr:von Willebrand factor D and EGF domain-containing protein-like [Ostrea edulis]
MTSTDTLWISIVIISLFSFVYSLDPCKQYTVISNQHERSSGYTLAANGLAISDSFLAEGWYRFSSGGGNDMVTTAPSLSQCGTIYPIWLNGRLPTGLGKSVDSEACVVGIISSCESKIRIKIQNCNGFRVYYLRPPQSQATGYCIGEDTRCPSGQGSETGFTPCQVVPHIRVSTNVAVGLESGKTYIPSFGASLEAVFKCNFRNPSSSYYYDVHWFINGDEVKIVKKKPYRDIQQTWLRPADWVEKYNLNMIVKCSVRVRTTSTGIPANHNESPDYEAGIFPTEKRIHIKEGAPREIQFRVTVPVGCIGVNRQHQCSVGVYLRTPEYQSAGKQCSNYANRNSISFDRHGCGIEINSLSWNSRKSLNITGNVDNMVNKDEREIFIRLGVNNSNTEDASRVWDNVTIPDIQVMISDADIDISHKRCSVQTDPRMTTFDGLHWNAVLEGEFVLYRHKTRDITVHLLTTRCSADSGGSCSCGIAVKVEDSLFVYRTCQEVSYKYVKSLTIPAVTYEICDDKHMRIDNRPLGTTTIYLPGGTKIIYNPGFWSNAHFLHDTTIYPSIFDQNKVEGLCGNFNGGRNDDILHGEANFQRHWRVDSSNSLFGVNPVLTPHHNIRTYCSCTHEITNSKDPLSGHHDIKCGIDQPVVECAHQNATAPFTNTCRRHQRKKRWVTDIEDSSRRVRRSVMDSDDVVDEAPPLKYDPDFDPNYIPPVGVWRNGWNEAKARSLCEQNIIHDPARAECETYINITQMTVTAVEECILDIRDSGTADWLASTVTSLKRHCNVEIQKYEKFYLKNDTQTKSIVELFSKKVCMNDCSGKGVCVNGECSCNTGYIGTDCSVFTRIPPNDTSIPEEGLCRKSIRRCQKTNIMGLFYSEIIHVRFGYFVVDDSGRSTTHYTTDSRATYRSTALITVDIPTTRKKRQTAVNQKADGFEISLSYDGITFGRPMAFLIFDDLCFNCNSTVTCSKLSTCKSSGNKVTKLTINIDQNGTNTTFIISGVVGGVIVLIIGILVYVKCKKTQQKTGPSFSDSGPVECSAPPTYQSEKMPYYKY